MTNHPEYLQAIGLVAVEISMMEVLLATVPRVGAAIYYAAKAASARVDILIEAARVALANNRLLLRRIESLAKLAKGTFDDRHRVDHHLWSIPPRRYWRPPEFSTREMARP